MVRHFCRDIYVSLLFGDFYPASPSWVFPGRECQQRFLEAVAEGQPDDHRTTSDKRVAGVRSIAGSIFFGLHTSE